MYKILLQQRKLAGQGMRISVDHIYFGENGDASGLATAPDRYVGTIIDWKDKRSADPKVRVLFDGESTAVTCPLATLLSEQYYTRFEAQADGTPAPVLEERAPRAPRAATPAPAAAGARAGGRGDSVARGGMAGRGR